MRYLIVLLLTGCVIAPADLRQRTPTIERSSKLTPDQAAACVSGAAAEHHQSVHAQIHNAGKDREVFVYAAGGFGPLLLAIVRAEPSSDGTLLKVMVQPSALTPDAFATAIVNGCE